MKKLMAEIAFVTLMFVSFICRCISGFFNKISWICLKLSFVASDVLCDNKSDHSELDEVKKTIFPPK